MTREAIIRLLDDRPRTAAEIRCKTGMSHEGVYTVLVQLEARGEAVVLPGPSGSRVWEAGWMAGRGDAVEASAGVVV